MPDYAGKPVEGEISLPAVPMSGEEHKEHKYDFLGLTLETAVYEALGAASVCWEDMSGTGTFQDDKAKAIAEALLVRIRSEGL